MLNIMNFTESEAAKTIEQRDFSDSLLNSSDNVALVLTQDWCPQWKYFENALRNLANREEPKDKEINVYIGIYNLMNIYEDFMAFKENVLGNEFVPYIRYYKKGKLIHQSNFVSGPQFLSIFD